LGRGTARHPEAQLLRVPNLSFLCSKHATMGTEYEQRQVPAKTSTRDSPDGAMFSSFSIVSYAVSPNHVISDFA